MSLSISVLHQGSRIVRQDIKLRLHLLAKWINIVASHLPSVEISLISSSSAEHECKFWHSWCNKISIKGILQFSTTCRTMKFVFLLSIWKTYYCCAIIPSQFVFMQVLLNFSRRSSLRFTPGFCPLTDNLTI